MPCERRLSIRLKRLLYALVEFKDAFHRYLPDEDVTPSQPNEFNNLAVDKGVTPKSDVTAEPTKKTQ